ncbi:MAG: AAA family ATPase [Deltaproteobacteria bacterium]|nr:AAA family ATPase [Deltaproteobacteria bacterium]
MRKCKSHGISLKHDFGWQLEFPPKRVVVFIDEIQHLDNPSSFLKYLHDHNKPRLKFVVTGSSSLELKKKFTDRLTGRVYRFTIRPLDFQEFLEFKNKKDLAGIVSSFGLDFWVSSKHPEKDLQALDPDVMKRLNRFLDEYLIYGGYPAVTLEDNPLVKQRDIQEIYSF